MNKTKRLEIRLSEQDYETISKKAEKLDMTISEYVRQSATQRKIKIGFFKFI